MASFLAPDISRRGAAAAIAAGYAAIATVAHAAPITTSDDGLVTATASADGLPLFVARPDKPGRHPAVIVVSEVFGVHEYIRDICRRLARQGYVAVAPSFFFRADPENRLASMKEMGEIIKLVSTASYPQQMEDVGRTLDWLAAQPFTASGRTAITGFCWGGTVVWMAAARFPAIKAGVAWYGRLSGAEGRGRPLDIVDTLKAPVLGLYGEKDGGIPLSDVEAMNKALAASSAPAARASTIRVYAGADHAFHADYRPSYKADAAMDGWKRMLAHFRANGV
ncbi:dienelactone hydrolase family protein [Polymorphobacter sp.]|uniref:dienelactone hydrolase family protein n=1 Tax=Polymorphobacter sp. TaxID=1909290 RepID=UPI003F706170